MVILNCSYRGGLKLRKLVINDWVYVFPRVVCGGGGGGGWGAVEMACTCLGDFCWDERLKRGKIG